MVLILIFHLIFYDVLKSVSLDSLLSECHINIMFVNHYRPKNQRSSVVYIAFLTQSIIFLVHLQS